MTTANKNDTSTPKRLGAVTEEENERLTRVGPDTPMGKVFRSYWIPACLASEVPTPDCAPVRVRLLGEDLVAFRDTDGKVGLIEAYCAHRRAPLFFGRNEDSGIRCVYHGWKYDVTGQCVDLPSEPARSRMVEHAKISAYPTYEAGGVIWTYMGPEESAPSLPDYEWLRVPTDHFLISKTEQACNFLQAIEGGIDSAHVGFLHNENINNPRLLASSDNRPRLEVDVETWGYRYVGIRNLTEDQTYVRGYQFLMPCHKIQGQYLNLFQEVPSSGDLNVELAQEFTSIYGHHWVPMDDFTTATYNFHYPSDTTQHVPLEYFAKQEANSGRGPESLIPGTFKLRQNFENDYLIDRERQRTQTYTGIRGVNTQDVAIQEAMGPVVDRTKELLGTTDLAIMRARQLLLEAAEVVESGGKPLGRDAVDHRDVSAIDMVIPSSADWRDLMKDGFISSWP